MKKILLLFVFLCTSIICMGQHLNFMGIPINGTITTFQSRLSQKGFKPSLSNKNLPLGVRRFEGYFTNKKADVIVFYNNQSKVVYMCRVIFDRTYDSMEEVKDAFESYKESLKDKYTGAFTSDMMDEEDRKPNKYFLAILKTPGDPDSVILGFVELMIEDGEYASQYKLWIDYTDATNYTKNENANNNDL